MVCDATPSDTAQLNKGVRKSPFVTNIGGRTSPPTIMARAT